MMTQEDKELLLKDLCARLPYAVKANISAIRYEKKQGIVIPEHIGMFQRDNITIMPYLRPRSEIANLISAKEFTQLSGIDLIDWYNANHIDYCTDDEGKTMIEKGLAIEATEGMYK